MEKSACIQKWFHAVVSVSDCPRLQIACFPPKTVQSSLCTPRFWKWKRKKQRAYESDSTQSWASATAHDCRLRASHRNSSTWFMPPQFESEKQHAYKAIAQCCTVIDCRLHAFHPKQLNVVYAPSIDSKSGKTVCIRKRLYAVVSISDCPRLQIARFPPKTGQRGLCPSSQISKVKNSVHTKAIAQSWVSATAFDFRLHASHLKQLNMVYAPLRFQKAKKLCAYESDCTLSPALNVTIEFLLVLLSENKNFWFSSKSKVHSGHKEGRWQATFRTLK